jgi:hypothetical protein
MTARNPLLDPAYYWTGDEDAAPAVVEPPEATAPDPAAETSSGEGEGAEAPAALAADVSEYHVGGGYYAIPGLDDKVKGKEDAQAALDALRAEG